MFKFKGISSSDMGVVIEEEELFMARATQRYEEIEVEGRNGTILEPLGYSSIERPICVQCLDVTKMDDILAWLNGEGILEYKNRITSACFYDKLEPQRKSNIRIIDTMFIRQPFWYKADDDFVNITNTVSNEGNIECSPIIRLEKTTSNQVDITINEVRLTYDFEDSYVIIDCKEKNAMYEGLNRNRKLQIGYDFPKIKPGNNTVRINSGTCNIAIKRKDCWL